jgi:hypothetical protein
MKHRDWILRELLLRPEQFATRSEIRDHLAACARRKAAKK